MTHGIPVPVLESHGFSVAAIPINYSDTLITSQLPPGFAGIQVQDGWQSDSGNPSDLTGIAIKEEVQVVQGTGVFSGETVATSGYENATDSNGNADFSFDSHGILTTLNGVDIRNHWHANGVQTLYQTHVFWDRRTGDYDIPIAKSGYVIYQTIAYDQIKKLWAITVTKKGQAVTAQRILFGFRGGLCNWYNIHLM